MKSVCVVTVTYGNRSHLLAKVVESCIQERVQSIIIVDNGSTQESKENIDNLVAQNPNLIDWISLDENFGSAGGYKRGLMRARELSSCDYIWVLDDDNVPQQGALESLLNAKALLSPLGKIVLVSYRKILDKNFEVINKAILWKSVSEGEVLGERKNLTERVIKKFHKTTNVKNEIIAPLIKRVHASYGGMFIDIAALDEVGYPNEDFYLYADDIEYSGRFSDLGYKIFTCYMSQIIDIDYQLGVEGYFNESQSDIKVYYSLRNHFYLSGGKSKSSLLLKFLNIEFNNINKIKKFSFFCKRSLLVLRALNDGRKGKLGRII